jgi:succinate dehydrogenase/fumarate reductase flavoprotein subunit
MQDIQFNFSTDPYDVIIVGSGAGGGMAAYELTKAGANSAPEPEISVTGSPALAISA